MASSSISDFAVVALAGRRVDAPDTYPPRFPLKSVPTVRKRIAHMLRLERAVALVSSAACGADLIGLEAAEELGIRRRIILPFPPQRFREKSVTDRPGDWGSMFDHLVTTADASGDLVVLENSGNDDEAYAAANRAVVREAQVLARGNTGPARRLLAFVVWEGTARPGTDASSDFRTLATEAGFEERIILTR